MKARFLHADPGQETLIDWSFPEKLMHESQRGPVPGARPVYWRIDGQWLRKGWLMPEVA